MPGHPSLLSRVHPEWAEVLAPVEPVIRQMENFLEAEEASGRGFLPAPERVLRAFSSPFSAVRVLIVGQDPYPTPGHPVGLSFAVERDVRPLPRSLTNIFRELRDDLGVTPPSHGDLSAWEEQGVLLLNRVLSVRPVAAGSHRGRGWETVTAHAIQALAARNAPLVAVLWGKDAQSVVPMLGDVPHIDSPHPSPLSASRGFFGSRPFSRVDAALTLQGATPIRWG